MANFISIDELKNSVLNANIEEEYIQPAIDEAQSIYLREILGDKLYNSINDKVQHNTLTGKYLTLVNQYIKPYLTYMVQSLIVIPINFKTRNAGVINQYDNGFSTTTMKDTNYVKEYYDSKAQFYGNRLTEYLQKNAADFPEYGWSQDNITQPTLSQNVTGIYLGGTSKKCWNIPVSGGGGGTGGSVEWDDILNKPDFATVATTGDYDDLIDKPTGLTQWFGTQAEYDLIDPKDPDTVYNIEGSDNVQSDWNENDNTADDYIKNKPTMSSETWTFELSGGTTVTKKVWLEQ